MPGQSHVDKITKVREELEKKKARAIVVNMLDEIAWLFNLRGTDIDFNPGMFFLEFLFDLHTISSNSILCLRCGDHQFGCPLYQ